jgi:hypothetical protein
VARGRMTPGDHGQAGGSVDDEWSRADDTGWRRAGGQGWMGSHRRMTASRGTREVEEGRADDGGWPKMACVQGQMDGHGHGRGCGIGGRGAVEGGRCWRCRGEGLRGGRLRVEDVGHHRGPQRQRRAPLKGGGEVGRHRPTVWQSNGGRHTGREQRRGCENRRWRGVCVRERGAGVHERFLDNSITFIGHP